MSRAGRRLVASTRPRKKTTAGTDPPVAPSAPELPLGHLTWEGFQRFCTDFISALRDVEEAHEYGRLGDPQQGIDILAKMNDGNTATYQCRRVKKFYPSSARKVINETRVKADHHYILITKLASTKLRQTMRRRRKWTLWDAEDISRTVRTRLPQEIARKVVLASFGPSWVREFLGLSPLSVYQLSEDYFRELVDPNRLFNHALVLVGRRDYLAGLRRFLKSPTKRVALLYGRGGIGKSKILHDLTLRRQWRVIGLPIYYISTNLPLTAEQVGELPCERCVVVVDDAHRRRDLGILLELIRGRNHTIKLILSARPQGVDSLRSELRSFSPNEIVELPELKELSKDEVRKLAKQVLGRKLQHHADMLADLTRDCPLVTVVAGGLMRRDAVYPSRSVTSEEFRHIVLDGFRDEILGKLTDEADEELCRKLLELVAAIAPIRPDDHRGCSAVAQFLGRPEDEVLKAIDELEHSGILLRRGHTVRIVPDVLSDYILHERCLTRQKTPTRYADRVYKAFKGVSFGELLRNLAELDWQTVQGTELLNNIWRQVVTQFKAGSHSGRCLVLDRLEDAARYLPARILDLVEYAWRNPATADEDSVFSQIYAYTHADVVEKLPELLRRVSLNLEYFPRCYDLLWAMGKDDNRILNPNPQHAIRILKDIVGYDLHKPFLVQGLVLDAVERWMRAPDVHKHTYSVLEIVAPILAKDGETTVYDDGAFVMRSFGLSERQVRPLRRRALSVVARCMESGDVRTVLRAVECVEHALRPPNAYFGRKITEKESRQWAGPDIEVMGLLERLVQNCNVPAVHMRIVDTLRVHTHRQNRKVGRRAQDIIASIPVTYEFLLTRVVSYSYDLDYWSRKDAEKQHSTHQEQMAAIQRRVAAEFLSRHKIAKAGILALEDWLRTLETSGVETYGAGTLLGSIAGKDWRYAARMCNAVILRRSHSLGPYLQSLLFGVRENDRGGAIRTASRAVKTGDEVLCRSIAGWYRYILRTDAREADLRILSELLVHPTTSVRRTAVACLAQLWHTRPREALRLAAEVDIGNDPGLAEGLARTFYRISGIPLDRVSDRTLRTILRKLVPVRALAGHCTGEFLNRVSRRMPVAVVNLMLRRIAHAQRVKQTDYKPVSKVDLTRALAGIVENGQDERVLRRTLARMRRAKGKLFSWLGSLVEGLSQNFTTDTSLRVLREWTDSGDRAKIVLVGNILRFAPHTFVRTQVAFTDNLITQAHAVSDECHRDVASSLMGSAISYARHSNVGEPAPQDITTRDEANAISKRFRVGSPTRQFYGSLAEDAQQSIDDSLARGEEL